MSCGVAAVEVVRGCKGDRMQRARRHKVEATVLVLCFLRRRLRGHEREEECRARRKSFDMYEEWKCCARSGTGRGLNFHSRTRWHVDGDYGCELGRQSRSRKRRSMRVHRARVGVGGTKVKGAIRWIRSPKPSLLIAKLISTISGKKSVSFLLPKIITNSNF